MLILYLAIRQISSTLGLTALGGHVQMVRPLIAPMAEAAAERTAPLDDETRDLVRANAAAADNIGVFFGEDVFVAIGSVLLIKGFLEQNHIVVAPIQLSVWAIPTAIMAFVIHATRLWLFDRRLRRRSAPMIGLDALYVLTGTMFAAFAIGHALDRSWRSALFWGCFALLMIAGSWLPDLFSGEVAILLAVLAALGLKPARVPTTEAQARETSAAGLRNKLFVPALAIPAITLAGTLLLPHTRLVDPKQVTLVSLAAGAIVGLGLAMALLRAPVATAMREGRRLVDSIGWAAVLPQMLAALGGVFAAAGVGKVVAGLTTQYIR